MSETTYMLMLILITGIITLLLRAFPFIAFSRSGKTPPVIVYIGKVVSPAAIAMLVVYCYAVYLNNRPPSPATGWGAAELSAGITVVALQLWKRNPLLSIIAGVIIYMTLVQKFFPGL